MIYSFEEDWSGSVSNYTSRYSWSPPAGRGIQTHYRGIQCGVVSILMNK